MELRWNLAGCVALIKMPEICTAPNETLWRQACADLIDVAAKLYIFDLEETQTITPKSYRYLIEFCRALEAKDKKVASLRLKPSIHNQIRAQGLEPRLNPQSSLAEVMRRAGWSPNPVADPDLLNPFIKSVMHVLAKQAGTFCEPLAPQVLTEPEGAPGEFIVGGGLSLESETFKGTIALCFPTRAYLAIYTNMVGEDTIRTDGPNNDGACELLNMIYGIAKAELNQKSRLGFPRAIPAGLSGATLALPPARRPVILLPFQTNEGIFRMEIALSGAA